MAALPAYQEWIEMIARMNPEYLANFKPSADTIARVQELLIKKSAGTLSDEEESELNYYVYLENMLGLAKARAYQLIQQA